MMKRTLLFFLTLVLTAFGYKIFIDTTSSGTSGGDALASPRLDSTNLSENSVYQLASTWTDQNGRTRTLPSFLGRPQLVSMVFTNCGYACPRIVHDVKQTLAHLPAGAREEVGVLLVSIDPDRDTPEVLKRFAGAHGLDEAQWTLLRSEDPDVRELAAVLDVRYKQEANGHFAHSNVVTLLDARGEIIHRKEGLGGDAAETARALEALFSRVES